MTFGLPPFHVQVNLTEKFQIVIQILLFIGTTVTQELIWLIANDMDYEGAKEPLSTRFPYLE